MFASDLYNEAPVWHLRLKAAAKRGATVIVAAARATKLDQFAGFVVRYAYGDEVKTASGLISGPDFYELFLTHLTTYLLSNGIDPTPEGAKAMNLAWFQVLRPILYH